MEAFFSIDGLRREVANFLCPLYRLKMHLALNLKDNEEPLTIISGHNIMTILTKGEYSDEDIWSGNITGKNRKRLIKNTEEERLALMDANCIFILEITPNTRMRSINAIQFQFPIIENNIIVDYEEKYPVTRKIIVKCKYCNEYIYIKLTRTKENHGTYIKTYLFSPTSYGSTSIHCLCKCRIPPKRNFFKENTDINFMDSELLLL